MVSKTLIYFQQGYASTSAIFLIIFGLSYIILVSPFLLILILL